MKRVRKIAPNRTTPTGQQRFFTNKELRAVTLLSMLGASDEQISMYFNVPRSTVEYWIKNNADFRKSRKRGGINADMKVAQALLKRALGYSYEEKEFTQIKTPDGRITQSQLVRTVQKHVTPDVKAIIHWLRIKQREEWSVVDETRHLHAVSGKVEHMHRNLQEIPTEDLSKGAQTMLFEIAQQQLLLNPSQN
jgi:hypothetical protein